MSITRYQKYNVQLRCFQTEMMHSSPTTYNTAPTKTIYYRVLFLLSTTPLIQPADIRPFVINIYPGYVDFNVGKCITLVIAF